WTQSVSRRRWLLTKLALLGTGCVVLGLAFGALNRWLLEPYVAGAAVSPVEQNFVSLVGIAPAAMALFAFALGTAAGALVRRPLPAMAITLAVFVAVRLAWEPLRYQVLRPFTAIADIEAARPLGLGRHDWLLPVTPYVDARGTPIDDQVVSWCGRTPTKGAF